MPPNLLAHYCYLWELTAVWQAVETAWIAASVRRTFIELLVPAGSSSSLGQAEFEKVATLVAESGVGVIENLKAIYSGLASRWLHAFEADDDHKLSLLTGKLHANLEMQARITNELSPGGSVHIQNNYLTSDVTMLLKILAPYPEATHAIVEYYRERSAPLAVVEHRDGNE